MGQGINSKIAGLGAAFPLLMRDEIDAGRLVPGSLVDMVAFGAGLGRGPGPLATKGGSKGGEDAKPDKGYWVRER